MNHITIMGRLTRDPEMRTTPTGVEVCTFSVAVDRGRKNQDGTRTADFFDCEAWRQQAAFVHTYFKKGQRIAVEGAMEFREYEKDGIKRRVAELKASRVHFCESSQRATSTASAPASMPAASDDDDDDLPFLR
jgi:single-strand DNA-binding protein